MEIVKRRMTRSVLAMLEVFPSVVLTGARQVGKTTLARAIAQERESVYYDLENSSHREQLSVGTVEQLTSHEGKLIVLDEIQQAPDLFMELRSAIDRLIAEGRGMGNFLLMGSAQGDLLHQSRENLAGRTQYLRLHGFDWLELGERGNLNRLWERGGHPASLLAPTDEVSWLWREAHLSGAIASDFSDSGVDARSQMLEALLMKIAEGQGNPLKISSLAAALGIAHRTLEKYLNLLVKLMVVRKLPAYGRSENLRSARRPKVYLCDSGLFHVLRSFEFSHPRQPGREQLLGASWEGFVIENLMAVLPRGWRAYHYRDYRGNEVDLVLRRRGSRPWAVEIKSGNAREPTRHLRNALAAVEPERAFQVYRGTIRKRLGGSVEALSLADMMEELLQHNKTQFGISREHAALPDNGKETLAQGEAQDADPAAAQADRLLAVKVHIYGDGAPLQDVDVLAVLPDKNFVRATTDAQGVARLPLHSDKQPLTVFAACSGFGSATELDWIPRERALALALPPLPSGGSLVLPDSHGEIPGLRGEVNPVRDRKGDLWMHTAGITIGGGSSQPVQFEFSGDLDMRDEQGNVAKVRVVSIVGRASLVEYRSR